MDLSIEEQVETILRNTNGDNSAPAASDLFYNYQHVPEPEGANSGASQPNAAHAPYAANVQETRNTSPLVRALCTLICIVFHEIPFRVIVGGTVLMALVIGEMVRLVGMKLLGLAVLLVEWLCGGW
ncbi:hypothetical protein MMC25_004023 [Agyrium rufum]|nr:hypothetical protein [Agyrium rufum]